MCPGSETLSSSITQYWEHYSVFFCKPIHVLWGFCPPGVPHAWGKQICWLQVPIQRLLQVCTEFIMSKVNIEWMTLYIYSACRGNFSNVMFSVRVMASFKYENNIRLTDREVIYKSLITQNNKFSLSIDDVYVIGRCWPNGVCRSQKLHSQSGTTHSVLLIFYSVRTRYQLIRYFTWRIRCFKI
jgi:hypothetical protein